jgi:hypothetical protein
MRPFKAGEQRCQAKTEPGQTQQLHIRTSTPQRATAVWRLKARLQVKSNAFRHTTGRAWMNSEPGDQCALRVRMSRNLKVQQPSIGSRSRIAGSWRFGSKARYGWEHKEVRTASAAPDAADRWRHNLKDGQVSSIRSTLQPGGLVANKINAGAQARCSAKSD